MRASARHLRLVNPDMSSRTSTCTQGRPRANGGERRVEYRYFPLSSFVSVRSLFPSPCRSNRFDFTGPLSVLSSPRPARCRPLFMYCQSAPPSTIAVITSALDDRPTSWPKFSYTGFTSHLMTFLDGAHNLCIAWHSYGG
jgi:hypothetical protein